MFKTMIRTMTAGAVLSFAMLYTPTAHGQALPTATGHGGGFQVGGGVTYGKPDFGQRWIGGVSAFADYNLFSHIGLEANAHFLTLYTPQDLGEQTYEAGPRFYWRKNRFTLYGKGQIGVGRFVVQESNPFYNANKVNSTSWMYSLGGGVDVNFSHHITVRAFDFEYQNWPSFANNGLTPAIGTVGLAYRFR